MAFDEDIPQPQLGPFQWILALVLLAFLAGVIAHQMKLAGTRGRRESCFRRQKTIADCIALWETRNVKFPDDTRGYACFSQRSGTILKSEGFPKAFTGNAVANCGGLAPWTCPERLATVFENDPARVPDDGSPGGHGNYGFVQQNKLTAVLPLPELVGALPPIRTAFCTVYGAKNQLGPDGRSITRHCDKW